MSSTERPAKRARLEADKRRAALAKVQDKYADIDFTRFQSSGCRAAGGNTPPVRACAAGRNSISERLAAVVLVRSRKTGWGELAHLCTTGRGTDLCLAYSALPGLWPDQDTIDLLLRMGRGRTKMPPWVSPRGLPTGAQAPQRVVLPQP